MNGAKTATGSPARGASAKADKPRSVNIPTMTAAANSQPVKGLEGAAGAIVKSLNHNRSPKLRFAQAR